MKKNLSVTLGGRSFTIDEDAFRALDAYIEGIRAHYAADDPDGEIVDDFESRIADLFAEEIARFGTGSTVTIGTVRRTIERVGPLDRLIGEEREAGEEGESEAPAADETGQKQTTPPASPRLGAHAEGEIRPRHIYYRSATDRWISGVLGGVGEYLGMDALLLRLVFIALLFTPVMPGIVIVYLAMTIFVPRARTVTQRLELQGIPVSPATIWEGIDRSMTRDGSEAQEGSEGRRGHLLSFIPEKTRKRVLTAAIGLLVSGIMLGAVALFVGLLTGDLFDADFFTYRDCFIHTSAGILFLIAGFLAGLPLLLGLIYVVGVLPIGMILQSKKSTRTVKTVSIILWLAFLFALRYILF